LKLGTYSKNSDGKIISYLGVCFPFRMILTKKSRGTVVVENTPTASYLTKIGDRQSESAGCRLCRILREARGDSTDVWRGKADTSWSHNGNIAGCREKMAMTVTATHHSI